VIDISDLQVGKVDPVPAAFVLVLDAFEVVLLMARRAGTGSTFPTCKYITDPQSTNFAEKSLRSLTTMAVIEPCLKVVPPAKKKNSEF
jgi:hypothetical protein